MANITIRQANITEIGIIIHHRVQMFADIGSGTVESRAQMAEHNRTWLQRMMGDGYYLGWFACDGDVIAAGLGLWLMDWIASPLGYGGRVPYILNVYTEPDYRRQGLARQLMSTCLDYCRAEGYPRVRLHASEFGRPLYEKLGFDASNEMQLSL